MAQVMVTGGGGFLGQEIRAALKEASHNVTLIKRKDSNSSYSLHANEAVREIQWPQEISTLPLNQYDYIIYLSHAGVSESQFFGDVLSVNFTPLEIMVDAIKRQNAQTHLLFISSQSADRSVNSNYGKLKRLSEELLLKSGVPGIIIRPGLIFGAGNSGLFNAIKNLIKSLPVIPLIGSSTNVIQPLYVKDFTKVLLHVSGINSLVKDNSMRIIEVANSPISFHKFIKDVALTMSRKRLFVPIPNTVAYGGLWILEHIFKYKKITTSSLFGFLQLSPLDYTTVWLENDLSPTKLDDALRESV